MSSGPTSCCWLRASGNSALKALTHRASDMLPRDLASRSASGAKPKGAGMQFSAAAGSTRRSLDNVGASSAASTRASTSAAKNGASTPTAAIDTRTATTRRRSQRTAPARPISGPRSVSAAASMLVAVAAAATVHSIIASDPGNRAARKSGNRLNVIRPCGQYQRAMRTPGLVRRR